MGSLARYLAVRAALIVPSVLILYTLVFIILRVIPGNPILAALGARYVPPEYVERKMEELGLNKPLVVQYFEYLANVLRGDFGYSLVHEGEAISAELKHRIPATIELAVWGFAVSVLIGIGLGVLGALRRGGAVDKAVRVASIVAYTLFIPWLGSILILVFSVKLGWLPAGGRLSAEVELHRITGIYTLDALLTRNWAALKDAVEHLILPSITLGVVLSGAYIRVVRSSLSDVLQSDFIRAYRARGVRERKVLAYALRNALIPVVTLMGLQFAMLLGGAVLTETTYSWPGLGSYLAERIGDRDYTAIQGAVIVFAFLVGLISLIVDAIYALIDPRIRY